MISNPVRRFVCPHANCRLVLWHKETMKRHIEQDEHRGGFVFKRKPTTIPTLSEEELDLEFDRALAEIIKQIEDSVKDDDE
ncbi:hypothetical protein A0H81_01809 [Grifola frondosa]|uniref:Uncharacterized protein n=1 Tax=Grifola frondosa TaxID=5627 RepID=A0A1C7MM43_GRIFR|nr:hypothetical protein A0H81_01809 [Grifola frondosa]